MPKDHSSFAHPLTGRYAAKEMRELFSEQRRISLWRRVWLALAESQRELGLAQVSEDALKQMRAHLDDIDFERAAKLESELRHDVMAHVHTFGEQCPAAKPIIHLGATSMDVTDNADFIIIKDALDLVLAKLRGVMQALSAFAKREAKTACLGYTHFQVAQPTTVGKRASLWLQDLLLDYEQIKAFRNGLKARGLKGTTGTAASFMELFDGDEAKVRKLDELFCKKLGASASFTVTGQTYTRKYDHMLLSAVAGLGVSAQKCATDIRLLMGFGELDEPMEGKQVGSSAMAYKRNPMRSERVCSISRYLINLPQNAATTAAEQWLERTLDDSANRRMVLPETFLAADVVLSLLFNIAMGLKANQGVISARLARELPLMATEAVIMAAVRAGGDRQAIHEAIRVHSLAAVARMKEQGASDNDLFARLKGDTHFKAIVGELDKLVDPQRFIGLAESQTLAFLANSIAPALAEGEARGGESIQV